MLKIKLKPNGKIHQRSFRVVVSECRSKSNGKFVDDIGFYTPQSKTLQIDKVKMAQWLKNGAQLTEGVDKLLNPDKYPRKKKAKEIKEKVSAEGGSASGGEKITAVENKTEEKAEEIIETKIETPVEEKNEEVVAEEVKEEVKTE